MPKELFFIFGLAAVTFVLETILEEAGRNKQAKMLALAGYTLTLGFVVRLVYDLVDLTKGVAMW